MLRRQIGWLVAQMYAVSGRRAAVCRRVRRERLVVPVLFHGPSPEFLDGLLAGLDRFVGLENVEITFDDGRKAAMECVPVLEKYGVPAVFFISPGEILRGYNWAECVAEAGVGDFAALCRMSADERWAAFDAVGWSCNRTSNLMSVEDVRALANHRLVEFGNHTWSHLSCVNRPLEEVLVEIDRAQAQIAEWTGRAPSKFSYPFGHDTPELDAAVRARGLVPYSLRPGLSTRRCDGRFRNMAYENMTFAENIGRLLMAWPGVRRMPS